MDRESYEFAAKAAGYEIKFSKPNALFCLLLNNSGNIEDEWHPLESDADAFRLQVAAEIDFYYDHDRVIAVHFPAKREMPNEDTEIILKISDFADKAAAIAFWEMLVAAQILRLREMLGKTPA